MVGDAPVPVRVPSHQAPVRGLVGQRADKEKNQQVETSRGDVDEQRDPELAGAHRARVAIDSWVDRWACNRGDHACQDASVSLTRVILGIFAALVALAIVSVAIAYRSIRWRRFAIVASLVLSIGAFEALLIYLDTNEILTP